MVPMKTVIHLLEKVNVQDIIALFFSGIVGIMWLVGTEVPEGLLNVTLIIIGFFFGDKNAERAQARAVAQMNPAPAPPYIADPED
jgi:hypothetical protein